MFTQISWSNYLLIVLLLSVSYYFVIGYIYYRNDLLQSISDKKRTNDVVAPARNYPPILQSFSDEVQALMNEAGNNKLDRKDIIWSLQMLIKKYPGLKDFDFQEPVQTIINNECKSYCSIHLSEEELSALWN